MEPAHAGQRLEVNRLIHLQDRVASSPDWRAETRFQGQFHRNPRRTKKNKGKSFVIIGHVESTNTFVAYVENKKILSINISELQVLADKHKVNLFLLGYYTKSAIRSNNGNYIGTLSGIRASRAVEQLTHAAEKANTWADFLEYLSATDLPLVVSNDFLHPSEKKDSEKKDSEKKDSEKKDSEKKDSEKKDSEKKDSEKKDNNKFVKGDIYIIQDNKSTGISPKVGRIFFNFYCFHLSESGDCEGEVLDLLEK